MLSEPCVNSFSCEQPLTPNIRFRKARERAGLSHDQVSAQCGFNPGQSSIWDIETQEDELTSCYSPVQVRKLANLFEIHPAEFFTDKIPETAISAEELVTLIHQECASRCITLEQFEHIVGWRLGACIDRPDKLLSEMTVDSLQWLCRELSIDWLRAL